MEMGEYIKKARSRQGMTARELARRSGVSKSYLSQLETGKNDKPSQEIMQKLADTLNVRITELYEVSGHFGSYIDEKLTELEQKNKTIYEDDSKIAENFNLRTIDFAIESLDEAVYHQKEILRGNKQVSFQDAALLNSLYKAVKGMNPADFQGDVRTKIISIIRLLLSNARDIDIDDIHKRITESEKKNNKE